MSCDTFYIVTSPSSLCPGEYIGVPCLTLQQYASNPSRSQNITFIIEPGMYNLSTVLTVSGGYNFTMSSINATVTCTSATARFEFNALPVENVHISGMTFQGCRNTAIRMTQVTSASIVSSNFINNQGNRGGCLYMSQVTSANILRSTFISNQAVSGSSRNGGCFYMDSSSVTISESEFRNNRAYFSGGAIYASSSMINIKRSQFSYNIQEHWYLIINGGGGGAIYASSSYITVNGSVFSYNNAHGYYSTYSTDGGGAMCTRSSRILQVINTTFIGNRANSNRRSLSGGAILVSGQSATVIQCYFTNNYANVNGGGLYNAGGSLTVTQTNFSSNSAAGSGGGIYTDRTLTITECNFLNNIAGGSGGGIYITAGTLNTTECNFLNNAAGGNGGAIYKTGSNDFIVIGRNIYSSNTAYSFGGAVYVLGTNSSISVFDCHFTNNTAMTEGGGAIYSNGQYANVILTSSTFHNNSASYSNY